MKESWQWRIVLPFSISPRTAEDDSVLASKRAERVDWSQVAAFRLHRHHLLVRESSDLLTICRDVCGVQAQVLGSARLAFWARTDQILRQDIDAAISKKRVLVKTSAMRQTLHLLPAAEYHVYIAALRQSRRGELMRIMARIDVGEKEIEAMTAALMKVLGDQPVPQRELAEQVRPRISRKLQASMKLFWNNWPIFRPAIIEGLVCYGPQQGNEATLVRVDCWLPKSKRVEEDEAKRVLLRNYLGAYGPATLRDFSKWSGIPVKQATPVWESLKGEMIEVLVEDIRSSILRAHAAELEASMLGGRVVRLLPSFDPYLLAHVNTDHLVQPRHYKRVYRNQGWISPVILVNGCVAGIWSREGQGSRSSIIWELFEKLPKAVVAGIEMESERVACWFAKEA